MQFIIKHMFTIIIFIVFLIVATVIGLFLGIYIHDSAMVIEAAASWLTASEYLKTGELDRALFYASQAVILKKDDPLYLLTVAELFEAKGDNKMAIEFYQQTLVLYKKKKTGPIVIIEKRLTDLQRKER